MSLVRAKAARSTHALLRLATMCTSYRNFPSAVGDRMGLRRRGRAVLYDLKGPSRDWQLLAETGSGDIRVINEMFFEDPYMREEAIGALLDKAEQPVVVDLGANKGYFSLRAVERNPQVAVFAYEPHPANFRYLEANVRLNDCQGQVRAFEAAVTGRESTDCELIVGPESGLHTTSHSEADVKRERFGGASRRTLVVQATSAPSALEEAARHTGTITLLKVDIEGGEREVLESIPGDLWGKILGVVAEVEQSNWPLDWLEPTLRRQGFQILSKSPYLWAWK